MTTPQYINSQLRKRKPTGRHFTPAAKHVLETENKGLLTDTDILNLLMAEEWCRNHCRGDWASGLDGRAFAFRFEDQADADAFARSHYVET